MHKLLRFSAVLIGTALGKTPTVTMVVDVPIEVDLALLREVYDTKRENRTGDFNKNGSDWPVFQALFHALREESSLLFNTTTFHVDDPKVLADVCSQVPSHIMGLILDTVEPDIDDQKVVDTMHKLVETEDEWGSDCTSCDLLREKFAQLVARHNRVRADNHAREDIIRASLESAV